MQKRHMATGVILLLISTIGISRQAFAQTGKIDSLIGVIKTAKEDTVKVNILNFLSDRLLQTNRQQEARRYTDDALILAEKLSFSPGRAMAHYSSGSINLSQRRYASALNDYRASLNIWEDTDDQNGIANCYNSIASVYTEQGDYGKALENYFVSLRIKEKSGNRRGLAITYNNIGATYEKQGNYSNALKNHRAALKIREEFGDKPGVAASSINIGNVYANQGNYPEALVNYIRGLEIYKDLAYKPGIAGSYNNIGDIYARMGKPDEAFSSYTAAKEMREEMGDKQGVANTSVNIGVLHYNQRNYTAAIKSHLAALELSMTIGDKSGIAYAYINLGEAYTMENKGTEARKYLQECLSLSKELGIKKVTREAYNDLAVLDSMEGNFKSAYENHKMYVLYRDSMLNATKREEIVRMQMQYDFDKKEDSLRWQQTLTDTKLNEQIILTAQQQQLADAKLKEQQLLTQQQMQFLLLKETEPSLSNKGKMLQQLEIEKTRADIITQRIAQRAQIDSKQGQLLLLSKENTIQTLELNKQKLFKNYLFAGLVFFIALSVFAYRNYRTRQNLKLQTLRNKIASDLHDDIGSTLSSISIFSQLAQQQSKEVIPLLETIGESSRKMLDAMADIVWTINSENDEFEKIVLRMRSFAYELLGAKGIEFEFTADNEIEKVNLPMEVRKNLYLIFKEATNNLAKYSVADKVLFSIQEERGKMIMIIRDNRKGFDTDRPTEGNGLRNMKKRAEEIGAILHIDSIPGSGTQLRLSLGI